MSQMESRRFKSLGAVLVAASLSACALPGFQTTDPALQGPDFEKDPPPNVQEVVRHIQCALIDILHDKDPAFQPLHDDLYLANVSLTLDVTNDSGLSPSLGFIRPLTSPTNRTLQLGGQLTGTQERNITQSFMVVLSDHYGAPPVDTGRWAVACGKDAESKGGYFADRLSGDLGLRAVVAAGLSQDAKRLLLPVPVGDAADAFPDTPTNPTFGTTIEFTLVYGLGGGPTWTLSHFSGPIGSNSDSLVTWSRTLKDSLSITFAKVQLSAADKTDQSTTGTDKQHQKVQHAAQAAQDQLNRMLLQRLVTH